MKRKCAPLEDFIRNVNGAKAPSNKFKNSSRKINFQFQNLKFSTSFVRRRPRMHHEKDLYTIELSRHALGRIVLHSKRICLYVVQIWLSNSFKHNVHHAKRQLPARIIQLLSDTPQPNMVTGPKRATRHVLLDICHFPLDVGQETGVMHKFRSIPTFATPLQHATSN